ncbi:ferric reductase-like transmembrane domain-containing protein [Calothrix sp. CCY 0018]|uniref:ferric reductase-like transmembrane domain-containing protein n=1 Tax=Calothrix sp. CCY 0018 TaxID=3103864 RepID=UPI0039C5AD9D
MLTNLVKSKQSLIFLTLCLTSYIAFVLLALYFKPVTLANFLGFLALIAYIATLLPSTFRTVFPNMRSNKILVWLLKRRRHIGIISYVLASNHGLLMIIQKNINLLSADTYIRYFQGILILFIMSLLAITSNDWSVKGLKHNWKKLHQLTYLILLILPWHILDKMSPSWSYLTPLELIIIFLFVYFSIKRKRLEAKSS